MINQSIIHSFIRRAGRKSRAKLTYDFEGPLDLPGAQIATAASRVPHVDEAVLHGGFDEGPRDLRLVVRPGGGGDVDDGDPGCFRRHDDDDGSTESQGGGLGG